jgi:anaerobic magnesium-protoporphyrin IX monomethyl ester cyclase
VGGKPLDLAIRTGDHGRSSTIGEEHMGLRILLVGPSLEDNLSLRYLAGALQQAGEEVDIVSFNDAGDTAAVIEAAADYDAVGLSMAFQCRAREFLALAEALKQQLPQLRVIAGGHYASCAAEELLTHHPSIEIVVIHEGERTIVELARAGRHGQLGDVAGIVYRDEEGRIVRTALREVIEDLDQLSFPDRSGQVHFFAGVPTVYLLGSRGCVSNCDYCCISSLHRMGGGKRFRQRDPERVADEMADLYHRRGYRHFIFHDDNFLVPSVAANHRRLDALERAWKERGLVDIGLTLKCRPPDASAEVLARLKQMGLLRVFLGVESASSEGLHSIGRRQTVEQSERALEICRDLGISSQYTIMTFHPDTTFETLRTDLRFARAHIDHAFNLAHTEIYAKTPLEQRMIKEGRAVGDYLGRFYRIADPRADLACDLFCQLFRERAWGMRGLQDSTIGMDHLSAVLGHFYPHSAVAPLRESIRQWRLEANRDMLELFAEVIDLAAAPSAASTDQKQLLAPLVEREERTRGHLAIRTRADTHAYTLVPA